MNIKTVSRAAALVVATGIATLFAEVDHHTRSAGQSMTRNAVGARWEGAYDNPALLGVERAPRGGILLAPFTEFGAGYWSDKLALKPYRLWEADSLDDWRELVEEILTKSFDIQGMTPDETTRKLKEEFKGGLSLYTGSRASLLSFNLKRFGVDVATKIDAQVDVPEGALFMLLDDVGLQQGNTLDMTHMGVDLLWRTDVRLALGLPVKIPALHRFFRLNYGAGGVAVKYVMGHSYLHAETEKGTLTYSADNYYNVDAQMNIQSAGTGLHGAWKMFDKGPFHDGLPVSGHGIGIDAGGILYDDDAALTINVKDLGVLFWLRDTRKVTYKVKKNGITAYDIYQSIEDANDRYNDNPTDDQILMEIFDRNSGEYISDSRDTLEVSESFVSVLPIALEIGYGRTWDFTTHKRKGFKVLFDHINVGLNYQQQLTAGPGQSYIPRLTCGNEFGLLNNYLPVRLGMIVGGPERWGSTLGASLNLRYFSINAAYKAIGHVLFVPRRGMELAVGMNFNWGMGMDKDKDGIPDKSDKCPLDPEDIDGFEDADGCPDFDNDQDGIPDTLDKCPMQPEDKDAFEDDDGCPELDNDKDAIPDSTDKCPNDPEDKDNFEDDDGCPDYDNDRDGVPDSTDKCPIVPEDIDNFEDADGCPEYDNDQDGIPDTTDNCPFQPEVYNGYQDADGCPDELPKPTAQEQKVLYTKLANINFKTGSAELTTASFVHLNFVADFLKKYAHLKYEIQGHTDSQGSDDYNLLLSAARAASVRGYLLQKGVPDTQLIAIGYGETRPIADNATAKGRAMNRRVEFKIVETRDDYERLRFQEAEFKSRIQAAKIKGAGKYGW